MSTTGAVVAALRQALDDTLPTRHSRVTAVLALLLLWTVGWGYWLPDGTIWAGERNLDGVITRPGRLASMSNPTYDVVVSLYNEELNVMSDTVHQITGRLKGSKRVIIYSKAERNSSEIKQMLEVADEVIPLPNIGREGETYLHHIARHYETAQTNIADFTLFLQPHLAWHWIFLPRVSNIKHDTGFMSFGPYKQKNCTHDSQGLGFPRMADIYSAFQGDLCPPGPHLSTWAGQFVVSRKRILDNPLRNYQNLLDIFHAPKDHWIWKESWWNHGPSNPTFGHVMERSWPVIFDCIDPSMAETCQNHESTCQCSD